MDIQALLGLLNGNELGDLASTLNIKDDEAKKGLSEAIPSILSALSKNTSTAEGAESLDKALAKYDGSVLNNIAGYLANPNLSEGAGILNHIFGNNIQDIVSKISKASGINLEGSTKLLQIIAPLVMGTLGKIKKETNVEAGALNGLINMAMLAMSPQNREPGGLMSILGGVLDSDKDGNPTNDLLNLAGNLFGKK